VQSKYNTAWARPVIGRYYLRDVRMPATVLMDRYYCSKKAHQYAALHYATVMPFIGNFI
jgi:hypothetical protein